VLKLGLIIKKCILAAPKSIKISKMKNTLRLALFTILLSSSLMYSQGVRYGFKVGANISSITSFEFNTINVTEAAVANTPDDVENGRFNFTASFFGEFTLNKLISLQPELAYSTQGNQFDRLSYDALQLPIGLRFNIKSFYLIGGPQVGLKISDSEQSDDFSSFEFAAFGGVGYHITENVFINVRYTYGFSELFEDDANIPIPIPQADSNQDNVDNRLIGLEGNSSYFTFGIGYRI